MNLKSNIWNGVQNSMRDWYNITYQGTKKNTAALTDLANQGQGFMLNAPTSYRRSFAKQNRDDKGRFKSGFKYSDTEIAQSMDKNIGDNKKLHDVESTAIQSARYDPTDGSLNVVYKGGDKEYKFAATPEDVEAFLNAPSKGQFMATWKRNGSDPHTYPGY